MYVENELLAIRTWVSSCIYCRAKPQMTTFLTIYVLYTNYYKYYIVKLWYLITIYIKFFII